MKKKLFNILLTACAFFSITLTACGGVAPEEDEPEHKDKVFNKIASKLVEDGQSEYKVVLPSTPTKEESTAADELVEFISASSGVDLEIVGQNTIDVSLDGKYIALGATDFLPLVNITLKKDVLGEAGYYMKTVNDCIIIAGYNATNFNGTLYGVYDFLKYTIGFEVYGTDEIYYEEKDTIDLYKFDELVRPSFDIRSIEYRAINGDKQTQRRLRFNDKGLYWCSFTHTLVSTFLPYKTYGASHPEYYGTTSGTNDLQLCYTNQGAFNELVNKVESRLASYPDTEYCMLGQEDNWSYCRCPSCSAAIEKFGCLGGLEMDFTNRVAKAVDEWLHNAFPGRKVTYVFFAYNSSIDAPVNVDANGNRTRICDELVPYENTGVMLAPIGYDFGTGIYSDSNSGLTATVDNWSWLFNQKNQFVWSYCIQSRSNFFHMPNFGVQREFYRYYERIGTKMLYDQGCYAMNTPALQAMRTYISSKMMWDTTYNYFKLAYDFIDHYYGEASKAMTEYFDFIVNYYAYLRDVWSVNGKIFTMIDDITYWPQGVVNSMLSILDRALEELEPLKNTNLKRYEELYDRVQFERCSPLYMTLKFYLSTLSKETKEAYLDDFEYYTTLFDIKGTLEGGYDVKGLIENWRAA